ncbi:MAG: tRNA pseudouridine(38-40) synthase TruA [Candidatus Rokubacteria bacterium]|nr:tRNA pseudouridine(38-40) synthase TruA [Candidatus Rokubacteria bacterium]
MFRLVLSYDGTDYAGWQTQPDVPTVQRLLTDTARDLLGPAARVTGASRTDAGVHALRQTVSLSAETGLDPAAIQGALNAALPPAVRVVSATLAGPDFNARRAAVGKRYAYLVDNGAIPSPLLRRFAWHVPVPLDVLAMRRGLAALRGRHDFTGFCAAAGRAQPPVCVVRALHVVRKKRLIGLFISADRYLHHMVRNIVGSAVAVGRGAREPAWLAEVLASGDRRLAGPTAPAHGLVLVRALYPK